MTETFKASNGRQIDQEAGKVIRIWEGDGRRREDNMLNGFPYLNERDVEALREFFQHERDQELGRWRDPELTHFYVINDENGKPIVVDERSSRWTPAPRDLIEKFPNTIDPHRVATRYFAAHPEPKPWQDARDGQLWLIRFSDYPNTDVSALVKNGTFVYNDRCHDGIAAVNDSTITAGRRIWPEVSDA